jgi:acyl dehydratase
MREVSSMKYPQTLAIRSDAVLSRYDEKDTILYALGIGMAQDPLDSSELAFVYEKALRVVPTMSAILATGTSKIIAEGEVNFAMILHGEQRLQVHKPLPPSASIKTSARCLSVIDKGMRRGALLNVECTIADASCSDLYATIIMTLFCRGDGGFNGPTQDALVPHQVPTRAPDRQVTLSTRPDQALIYRLSGDRNPLHCDPQTARLAGFERPILHGLCTYGFACRAVLQAYCDYDPGRIRAFDVRFASPVYPGETIVTRMWKDGGVVSFECSVTERDVTVIRNGRCSLS